MCGHAHYCAAALLKPGLLARSRRTGCGARERRNQAGVAASTAERRVRIKAATKS
jgi:hypothetical protein